MTRVKISHMDEGEIIVGKTGNPKINYKFIIRINIFIL